MENLILKITYANGIVFIVLLKWIFFYVQIIKQRTTVKCELLMTFHHLDSAMVFSMQSAAVRALDTTRENVNVRDFIETSRPSLLPSKGITVA